MVLHPDDRILFTGSSSTCSNRHIDAHHPLGTLGYVVFAAARLMTHFKSPQMQFFNRGVNGDRVRDLRARLENDLIALQPTVVSILIGGNDTWRRYDSNDPTSIESYEADYRAILTRIRDELGVRVVLLGLYLLHVSPGMEQWREDLDPRIDSVRRLALEFGTDYIPVDALFARACTRARAKYWAEDGVHPTIAGHQLIAEAWLRNAGIPA
jgi:lysophospholipase L1-like esterase